MKYLYRLILLAIYAVAIFVSCMEDEGVFVPETSQRGNIQIIGAVVGFDSKVVGTKALGSEEDDESLITEMTMFIFDKAGNAVTSPVTIRNYNASPDAFMIEIGTGQTGIIGTLNGQKLEYDKTNTNLDKCSIYIVANAEHYKKTDASGNEVSVYSGISTLDELLAQTLPLEGFEMPRVAGKKAGFPMIGTAEDGTTFNLLDASQNQNTVATIPLRKLYSKVTVNILVHADQVVSEPEFELLKWSVKNSPNQVRLGSGTTVTSYEDSQETKNATNQIIIHTDAIDNPDPSSVMSFTFYMPEHLVYAEKESSYSYPPGVLDNEKQKFKPALLGDGQKATYVLIEGIYTDHNGLVKQVAYRLYLGQNNYNDFKVIRNQHLINQVTIKGLTNSTNAIVPGQPDNISVDHRVDITNEGLSIAMERETLMDAHFEFRPVDITLSPNSSLTVTIPESDRTWIAIEQSQPAGASHVSGVGIRKYFTTDLISTLTTNNASDVAGPVLTYENNTDSAQKYRFWVYVDENPNVYDKTGHGKFTGEGGAYTVDQTPSRKGKIVFEFTDSQGTQTLNYNLEQRNLWRIWNGDWNDQTATPEPTRYYDIEYHEEYLYNYAADDPYGATTDGMEWGLDGVQLSHIQKAAYVDKAEGFLTWFNNNFDSVINQVVENNEASPYYDFYLTRDNPYAGITPRNYNGYVFNKEIITSLTSLYNASGTSADIKKAVNLNVLLDEDPVSAIAYCYNKNKRLTSGGYVDMNNDFHWYLPAIDEIEEITYNGYGDFDVFQNKLYWSCQPAFENNNISVTTLTSSGSGTYKADDLDRARATKIYMDGTEPRNVTSAADGVFNTLNVEMRMQYIITGDWYISSISVNETNQGISWDNHEGNKPRTGWKNRVRCVYRSGNVN